MRLNPKLLLSLLLLPPTLQAQTQTLPIELNADHGEYDVQKGIATYTGNVKISQGAMTLQGDKITIRLNNNQVEHIEAWGNLATFHYQPKQDPAIDGEGQHLIYDLESATITIDKQAHVRQGEHHTQGERLTYHLKKEIVQGSRVHMTFQPKTS